MLEDSIGAAQRKDSNAILTLIERFQPLLRKYAYKLHYEDAYYDLQLDFIQIIQNIKLDSRITQSEGAIVNYICNSVHHAYCKRLKYILDRPSLTVGLDTLTNAQIRDTLSTVSRHSFFDVSIDMEKILTEKERTIIILTYEYQLSSAEIARKVHTTRQSINQCKRRAEQKLRVYYENTY